MVIPNVMGIDIYVEGVPGDLQPELARLGVAVGETIRAYDADGETKDIGGPHSLAAYLITMQDKEEVIPIAIKMVQPRTEFVDEKPTKRYFFELEGVGIHMESPDEMEDGTVLISGKVGGIHYVPKDTIELRDLR